MKIKTKVVTLNLEKTKENALINKGPVYSKKSFQFEMMDVGAIMPEEDENNSIIFIQGIDLIVEIPYTQLSEMWNSYNKR